MMALVAAVRLWVSTLMATKQAFMIPNMLSHPVFARVSRLDLGAHRVFDHSTSLTNCVSSVPFDGGAALHAQLENASLGASIEQCTVQNVSSPVSQYSDTLNSPCGT